MFLSCGDEDLLIGNFIADFIRNRDLVLYSDGVVQGIRLHRHIDSFTDSHPQVLASTRVLRVNHGKYAPVVIDVCYDYILSKNWDRYANEPMEAFAQGVYSVLGRHTDIFPEHLADIAPRMIADNFLMKYGTEAGLRRTFERIGRRAKFDSNWSIAFDDLMLHYESIEEGFNQFFPEMIASVDDYCTC